MALAIDASSPAIASNGTAASADTATTASFTPPANSLLVVMATGDSFSSSANTTFTVTDNLGAHLTYTQRMLSQSTDAPAAGGGAVIWTAPVTVSAAMTVSVTNNSGSGTGDVALQVQVLTDGGTLPTVGANGKASSTTSNNTIAASLTATLTGSWSFGCAHDWNASGNMTAGVAGNTLISTVTFATLSSHGFFRRTTADGVNASATTITATLGGTSVAKRLGLVEIKGTVASTNPAIAFAPKRRRVGLPPRKMVRQGRASSPIPPPALAPNFVPTLLVRRNNARRIPQARVNPATTGPTGSQLVPTPPRRSASPRRFALARVDGDAFSPPFGVTAPPDNPPITATVFGRLRTVGRLQPRPRVNDPVPVQVTSTYYRMYEFASPPTASANDPAAVSVGVEFYVTSPATLTEIRWWQATTGASASSRTGALYLVSTTGQLAAIAATALSGTGWQTLTFATPVALTPGIRYKAVVYHPGGQYTVTSNYYASGADEVNGPLVFPKALNTALGQGTFIYGTGITYPNGTFNSSSYWIDVTVTTTSFLGTWFPFLARRRVFGKIRTPARAATPVPAQVIVSGSPAITATTTARTRRASAVYRRPAVTSAPLAGSDAPLSATTRKRLSILSGKRRASPSPLPMQPAPAINPAITATVFGRLRSVGRTVRRGEISTPVPAQVTPAVNPPITATVFGRLRTIGRIQPRARVNNPTQGQQPLAPNPPITATVFGRLRTVGRNQPRGRVSTPVAPQFNPPIVQTVFGRLRTVGRVRPRTKVASPIQEQQPLAPNPPITATVFGRLRTVGRIQPRGRISKPIPPQINPPIGQTVFARLRTVGRIQPRPRVNNPTQGQQPLAPNPAITATVFGRLRTVGRVRPRAKVSNPIPGQAQVVPNPPITATVFGRLRTVGRVRPRTKAVTPVQPQTDLPNPVFKRLRTVGRTNRIPRTSKPIPPQANPIYPVRPSAGGLSGLRRVWLKIRRKNAYPVPPQVTTLSGPITITDSHGGAEAGRSSTTVIGGTYQSSSSSTVSKGSSGGVTAESDNDNVAPTYDSDSDSL